MLHMPLTSYRDGPSIQDARHKPKAACSGSRKTGCQLSACRLCQLGWLPKMACIGLVEGAGLTSSGQLPLLIGGASKQAQAVGWEPFVVASAVHTEPFSTETLLLSETRGYFSRHAS